MQVAMKFDKRFFFDRQAVADIVGPKAAKALGKAGAFVRRRARSSMRRRKSPSQPGQPPSAHSKDEYATLKNIQFAFDPSRWSVLVGPIRLNTTTALVPKAMEFGHTFRRSDAEKKRLAARITRLFQGGRDHHGRFLKRGAKMVSAKDIKTTVVYQPRPFMGPAFKAEIPKFPSLFARST